MPKDKPIDEQLIKYQSGKVLHDKDKRGKDRPWRKKKLESLKYAEYLKVLEMKKAFKVQDCAETLTFTKNADGKPTLYQCWFCRSRLCPLCNWRRARKNAAQLDMVLREAVKQHPEAQFLFLTLTTKNTVNGQELKEELRKITYVLRQKVLHRKKIKDVLLGYVRSTEVTVNPDDGSYHQHMHVLLMVNNSYFSPDHYMKQAEWTALWKEKMQLDYTPIVHVQKVKPQAKGKEALRSAAAETAKYQTKSKDYLSKDRSDQENIQVVKDLEFALKGTRAIAYAGVLKDIHKQLHLDDPEDGDLVHDQPNDSELAEVVEIMVAQWNFERKNYIWR